VINPLPAFYAQVLPDNYAWLLLYFSSYAALHPLELETEVINIEIYITSLMPSFFGKQCRLLKHLAKKKS
jgi:hypothetical protein